MSFSVPHDQYLAIVHALQCKDPGCACHFDPQVTLSGNVHCPVHDDPDPSFTVTCVADRVLIDCKAGCVYEDTSQALRLIGVWSDPPRQSLTLEELAGAKNLTLDFLKSLGIHQITRRGEPAVAIPYYDEQGNEAATHVRVALTGSQRFRWPDGMTHVPYGVQKLATIYATGWVLFTEGESDCWSAWYHSLPVIGIPGKDAWQTDWAHFFPERLQKYIWCELDGWPLVDAIARDLPDAQVILAPEGVKDLSDAFLAGTDLKALLERLRTTAKPAGELVAERRRYEQAKTASDAFAVSAGLLDDPHLIDRIETVLEVNGLVGDKRNAILLYLAFTTAVTDHPVNVSIEGPSAAGKSFVEERVRGLFPEEAVLYLTSSSERAFVYTDTDLSHKHIVVSEASGLHQDGQGATIVRELSWGRDVVYEVTEKAPDGRLRTRKIVKRGPAGIVTTTVRAMNDEVLTRFFTITVPDDPAHTKEIVEETGRRAQERPTLVDVSRFAAAQRWIRTGGTADVVVPFGWELGRRMDTSAVRARRDITQVLTLISASAILHQRQRAKDLKGRIVATLEDYRIVYRLIAESMRTAKGGLTDAQRAAVEAVTMLYAKIQEPVSKTEVAKALGLDRSSASRRLTRPLSEGFVVNLEESENRPARLKPGDPLPPPTTGIPDPVDLEEKVPPPPENDCTPAIQASDTPPDVENIENSHASGVQEPTAPVQCMPEPEDGTPSVHCTLDPTTPRQNSEFIRPGDPACRRVADSGEQGTQVGLPQAGDPDEEIEVTVPLRPGDVHAG